MSAAKVVIAAHPNPELEVTISVRMTLRNWKYARDQFTQAQVASYEANQVVDAIRAGIDHIQQVYEIPLELGK